MNEELRSGLAPLGIAALHPKGPNGYENAELKTARVGCAPVTPSNLNPEMGVNESPKVEPETARRAVPPPLPPLPKTRRSALDEVDQPDEKEKKESKSKIKRAKKDDREMEPGA